jgi:hypothetical protein
MQEGNGGQLLSLAYAIPAPIPAAARDRPVAIAAPVTKRDRRFTGSSFRYCGSVVKPVNERLRGRPWRILGAALAPGPGDTSARPLGSVECLPHHFEPFCTVTHRVLRYTIDVSKETGSAWLR